MKKILAIVTLILLFAAPYAISATVDKVTLPDTYKVDDKELILNGTALRKKLMIKVYAGAFYAPAKISDAEKVFDAALPKVVRMHFIHSSVSGDKIQEAYTDVYKKDKFDYEKMTEAKQFLKLFSFEVKKDDTLDLVFAGKGELRVIYNGKSIGIIKSEDLCKATLKAYFGENSISGLKEGFLGK